MNGGPTNRKGLTYKENLLVVNYLKTNGNATKSAKLAGYKGNDNVLAVEAHRKLRKPKIQAELKRRMAKILSTDEVLQKLTEVAETPGVEVKASDKLKALELLGKFHKLFTDKVDHTLQFDSAIGKLRGEFPELAETELKSWLADILGANIEQISEKVQ